VSTLLVKILTKAVAQLPPPITPTVLFLLIMGTNKNKKAQ
jgi:hypothetical protein